MARRGRTRSVLTLALVVTLAVLGIRWGVEWAREAGVVGPPSVPTEYRALLREAAKRCPQVPVAVFAAQIEAESGWDPSAKSPVGASGIAQFMPAVWEQYGLDANNDDESDIWNAEDAIHAAAELNCVNRKLVKGASGKRLENTLAAYNAGFGAVLKYDGIPPFPETQAYVKRILETAKTIQY